MSTVAGSPQTCGGRFWRAGMDNPCTQVVGLTRWTDATGSPRAGCPRHAGGLRRRYPEALIEEAPLHGVLGLATPWARGLFGPNDRIAVANEIPPGWTLGVSVSARRSWAILWLIDPSGTERTRWPNHPLRAAVPGASDMARLAQRMEAEGPAPEVLVAS